MRETDYLSKYLFDWDLLDVLIGCKSSLDSRFFTGSLKTEEDVDTFLKGYWPDSDNIVSRAEIFGNFQESLQFIRRYFLKEGNSDGVDFKIPNGICMVTNINDLFKIASNSSQANREERLWAEIIFKVMHTIVHVDKDIRSNYFSAIQTQIFDRFYKCVFRDENDRLFLGTKGDGDSVSLVNFETKAKKTRDSVIIKMLHKAENVAEELFDRVGVRFITENRFDTLRVIKFLISKGITIPHNIKPSRSLNSIIDIKEFRKRYYNLLKVSLRNNLSEDRFLHAADREAEECLPTSKSIDDRNFHTNKKYRSIQFTCRQLIKYVNPLLHEFNALRVRAKELENGENELAKRILSMDISLMAKDIRFFYPFEVQIVDQELHKANTEGMASHQEYKKSQLNTARDRIFGPLLRFRGIV